MSNSTKPFSPVKLQRRLAAAPIQCGEWTIQPVAQLSGWYWAGQIATAAFAGALVRLQPLEIIAHRAGEAHTVPVVDPLRAVLSAMVRAALAVSILCALVSFLVRWTIRR
jgi:hypothetical protein